MVIIVAMISLVIFILIIIYFRILSDGKLHLNLRYLKRQMGLFKIFL